MAENKTKKVVGKLNLEFKPVDLKISVSQIKDKKVESCCNYDITGRSGNLLLVLPPMTHIQDMRR